VPIVYAVAAQSRSPPNPALSYENPDFEVLAGANFNLSGETTFFVRG
jgi:hypothetical protein